MDASVKAMTEWEPGTVEIVEPGTGTRALPGQSDPANDWLCAWCLHRVASEKDRYHHHGPSEFTFRNPSGMRFDILTFSRTIGCVEAGAPTLEHTWFPGHAWSFCLCASCGQHLGWHYSGPGEFDGLIRERIVRAMLVLN